MGCLLDVLNFYESSHIPLDRGLYLCYMKMHSSMNEISVVVPENLPSVLPFVYMRNNPHVSQYVEKFYTSDAHISRGNTFFREEWEWLRTLDTNQAGDIKPTPIQLAFQWSLVSAARILLEDLDVDPDHVPSHRLYRLQVVQVHSDVSFILVVPKVEDVCSAPTQSHTINATEEKRGCLSLSVPVFEMGTSSLPIVCSY